MRHNGKGESQEPFWFRCMTKVFKAWFAIMVIALIVVIVGPLFAMLLLNLQPDELLELWKA